MASRHTWSGRVSTRLKMRQISVALLLRTSGNWRAGMPTQILLPCRLANGMERSRTGGASLRTAMALAALAGKFGVEGGGVIAKVGAAFPRTSDKLQRTDWIPEGTRTLNILSVPEHILDDSFGPPVRGLVIYNHNPVATHPDQKRMIEALQHPDLFTLGIEIAMTDSMDYADVVLPAAGPFEIHDVYGAYGTQYLQRAEPVIPCVDEALPNTEIFRRLAARFGYVDPAFQATDLELIDDALDASDARMQGVQPSKIPAGETMHMRLADGPMIAFKNVFPSTPSGKVELYSEDLEERFGAGLPVYTEAPAAFLATDHTIFQSPHQRDVWWRHAKP